MAQMATVPVYACRRCGDPVYVTYLASNKDPNGEKLRAMMLNLQKIALCKGCLKVYNHLASVGRSDEFLINPRTVIYNVHDHSGLDYYGRKN